MLAGFEISGFVGRGKHGVKQFKQVFSNNKRKILYEITGSVKF